MFRPVDESISTPNRELAARYHEISGRKLKIPGRAAEMAARGSASDRAGSIFAAR